MEPARKNAQLPDPEEVKKKLIEKYPAKVAKKRGQQIVVNRPKAPGESPEILSNTRTTPGIITQRGCTYAGCKGVILGPVRDILTITHGPVGCGFYSWLTRRNQTDAGSDGVNYMPYALMTDMQEEDIVFGGEKKLRKAIEEAYELFKPEAIAVCATCPVGLIGDDIHAVARDMKEKLGINVFG
ncbi:MAG: nitrogenase molybdenum-iron protein alpha chain, partial [Deltaproteobacteria bacterium]|nr:nitrogenase molybdenum-iron protein alpha chain [Deltaproteobacteria bacterium]